MGLGWDIAGPGSGGMGAESNVARTPTLDGVKLGQPELSTKGFQCGLRRGAPFCRFSRVVWNGGVSWIFSLGGVTWRTTAAPTTGDSSLLRNGTRNQKDNAPKTNSWHMIPNPGLREIGLPWEHTL